MFKSNSSEIVKQAVLVGFLEVVYVFLVGLFLFVAGSSFPSVGDRAILGVLAFLTLLVVSVAVSGLLVFGYPVYYVMQKKYDEAMLSLAITLGVIAIFLVIIILGVIIV